jgi:ABC-2 type transport system permease protein
MAAEAIALPTFQVQLATLGRRSISRTLRRRRLLILPVLFPLILFAINASALTSAAHIPGFPPVSYRSFALATPFVLGAMLIGVTAGTDLAGDIESGFLDRLALTPLRGAVLLLGQLGGTLVLALGQSTLFLLVGLASGVTIAAGPAGAIVLVLLAVLIAFGFAGLGLLLAVRLGSGAKVQGFFPLLFVTVFLSSAFLPRNVITVRWFHDVATYNPISYLVEGLRSLIITGWDARALALGFGFAALLALAALLLASVAMKTRLVRT